MRTVILPGRIRLLLSVGLWLLACVAHADDNSPRLWSDVSLSGSSLPDTHFTLSKNLFVGTDHTEASRSAGFAQESISVGNVSKVAKAYLDYTFLNRQSENLGQHLQGRLGIANKSDFLLVPPGAMPIGYGASMESSFGVAHDLSGYRTDSGLLASLEWRLDAPGFAGQPAFDDLTWGEVLQVSFFADYGKALSGLSDKGSLSSVEYPINGATQGLSGIDVGTGLRFSLPGRLTANFKAAYPLHTWDTQEIESKDNLEMDGNRTEYWFDFSYNFQWSVPSKIRS